ncbi:tRNA (adenosine(37)-N6)-threonylcarbamoyltransferase complex transferase subunit TsaD [Solirubrobacter ginsenosidimutans]|uniref:tRNA N6-adenosine threonylcarbamoyltransferase n=1 Tax=Solirubrobacter ginsenosidimutans TaxID=490573 RepID=A0A9X3S927_9ACTN|nr:tRNA (adenosine(37)-N6)-threonylcarbamoyltransferase complex transferase subunit TsaD [Solirubrobacter ginsenosidimutans]MDA0164563.1 tRNA (adenosine(37)-N6)-threonylcarbamoyltransferase complex transferase subunit TsaD [Solirubrobacter ginsenosidimutans]
MSAPERLLAIETSCDETAAAVVRRDGTVESSIIHSQIDMHAEWGGVVPELASREHALWIVGVIDHALSTAGVTAADLSALAVTVGPGLPGSLAVGVSAATSLGLGWNLPVVAVNHLEGHLFSAELGEKPVEYPAVILLVSGGHCMLVHAPERGEYRLLGQTRDDSVGEAYDKIARELGLGYPGGPVLDRLAAKGDDRYAFPRPLAAQGYDFSFSGLKTAVRRRVEAGAFDLEDLAASFAAACCDVLLIKLLRAIEECGPKSAVVVGGVAASPILRNRLQAEIPPLGVELMLAPLKYATDNAAMIGAAAWWHLERGDAAGPALGIHPRLALLSAGG